MLDIPAADGAAEAPDAAGRPNSEFPAGRVVIPVMPALPAPMPEDAGLEAMLPCPMPLAGDRLSIPPVRPLPDIEELPVIPLEGPFMLPMED